VRQYRIEATDGKDTRSRAGADVDGGEALAAAERKFGAQQQALQDLEHPAVPVGQVEDEVGQRLGRIVELELITATEDSGILPDDPPGAVRIVANEPIDRRLDGGADVGEHARGYAR